MTTKLRLSTRLFVPVLVVLALVAGACGDDDDAASGATDESSRGLFSDDGSADGRDLDGDSATAGGDSADAEENFAGADQPDFDAEGDGDFAEDGEEPVEEEAAAEEALTDSTASSGRGLFADSADADQAFAPEPEVARSNIAEHRSL